MPDHGRGGQRVERKGPRTFAQAGRTVRRIPSLTDAPNIGLDVSRADANRGLQASISILGGSIDELLLV